MAPNRQPANYVPGGAGVAGDYHGSKPPTAGEIGSPETGEKVKTASIRGREAIILAAGVG